MDRFNFIKDKNFNDPVKSADFGGSVSPKAKQFDWASLPKTAGVYFFYEKNAVIYIGKAISIRDRVKNHFNQPSYRDDLFIDKVDKIGYLETGSEIEALVLEANLIKKYQPKFNVVWKDDKNYFYVAIAQNEQKVPYIFITHQKNQNKTKYIGPFVEGTALKKTLRFLRRVFPYYSGRRHPKTKCTWCHLGLCPGPNPDLKQYKKNIKKLILILEGKRSAVLNSLKKEMKNLSKENKFEKAGKVRDEIYNLQKVMSHTGVIESNKETAGNDWQKTQKILQGLTGINKEISRIECYDVSNIQGKSATGSMVVFTNSKPDKNSYRKFHIHPVKYREAVISQSGKLFNRVNIEGKPNDIAMLQETISRRLTHEEWPYPEIMLIDGGIAQLNIAIKTKNQKTETKQIKVISIAKRNKDLYIEGRKGFIPLKSLPQEIYNLILQLDDEAHRFAIAYHKKLRKRQLLT